MTALLAATAFAQGGANAMTPLQLDGGQTGISPSNESWPTSGDDVDWTTNATSLLVPAVVGGGRTSGVSGGGREVLIALNVLIFLLSVVGNGLVIVTLAQNRRMVTVTNVLLLNLAVSDLLLSLFCQPFTLVGALLRTFVFGAAVCKLIPFLQAVSVSVSVWTLVTISLERYFAICQPLRSRRWQTLSHIYKMIAIVWALSICWMTPIAFMSQLLPIKNTGKFKCREVWPDLVREQIFTLFLDFILLVVPLLVMVLAYWLISRTLYRGMQQEMGHKSNDIKMTKLSSKEPPRTLWRRKKQLYDEISPGGCTSATCGNRLKPTCPTSNHSTCSQHHHQQQQQQPLQQQQHARNGSCAHNGRDSLQVVAPPAGNNSHTSNSNSTKPFKRIIRRTNLDKSLAAKKRVIQMLFVVCLEFFVCWTPLYVINTLSLFNPRAVYTGLGHWGIQLFQLLAYMSSCSNPITYCFMHKKFRQGFLTVFGCRRGKRRSGFGRDLTNNDSSFYFTRQSTLRTELPNVDRDDDDRSPRPQRRLDQSAL